jgi:hypothetical protein
MLCGVVWRCRERFARDGRLSVGFDLVWENTIVDVLQREAKSI